MFMRYLAICIFIFKFTIKPGLITNHIKYVLQIKIVTWFDAWTIKIKYCWWCWCKDCWVAGCRWWFCGPSGCGSATCQMPSKSTDLSNTSADVTSTRHKFLRAKNVSFRVLDLAWDDIIDEMSIYCCKVYMNDWYFIKTNSNYCIDLINIVIHNI